MLETHKTIFLNWLKSGNTKKYDPEFCVSHLEKIEALAIDGHYSKGSFFEILDVKKFNIIKRRILYHWKEMSIPRRDNKKFEQIGALYAKFLKDKSSTKIADENTESSKKYSNSLKRNDFNWDYSIEEFLNWMTGKVSQSTCDNYYKNVKKLISDNKALWNKANELTSPVDIARNFLLSLSATIEFQKDNRIAHNQYSSALNKFIDFLDDNDSQKSLPPVRPTLMQEESLASQSIQNKITKVLTEKFKNGYRLNDVIDFERFKLFYSEINNESFDISEDQTDKIIASQGIRHNGKVYIVKKGSELRISEILAEAKNRGYNAIFYDAFYLKNIDLFKDIRIFDEEQVKELLKTYFPDLFFKSKYFSFENKPDMCIEIKKHFTKTVMSIKEIEEKLPYFMSDDIEKVLASNECFINNGDGRYVLIDKIYIPEKEEVFILSTVKTHVQDIGFFSVKSLPIACLRDWNPDVSDKALQTVVSIRCLRDKYEKKGSVIVQKDSNINAPVIVKNFCISRKAFTLADLTGLEIELRGSCHSQALYWALEVSVRIDADIFVNDSEISFCVEEIDLALERICINNFITLKEITNIYELPYLQRYHWNLYLLKSYAKRFSKKFEYMDLATNSANCGAIVRRSAEYKNFIQVMAAALIREGFTSFHKDDVNRFLVKQGYIFKASSQVDKIISEARKLMEVR